MMNRKIKSGGGFAALRYTLAKGKEAGGLMRLYKRMRAKNACKTCALGMGGQRGGMVNEAGHFPAVCKKSMQAQVADMQACIPEDFFRRMPISELERLSPQQCEALGRLGFPLMARPGDTTFRRVGWDEATAVASAALSKSRPSETFFYASGRASNEAAFLLQLVARAYGATNIHNCSDYCHAASGVALSRIYGSGTASVVLDDVARADLAIVIGANPASNHPRLISSLMELSRRGGKIIVINPLREVGLVRFRVPSDFRSMMFGSRIADLYLQPNIGEDIALCKALLKGVMERGALASEFITNYSAGWESVARDIERVGWDELVARTGVCRADLDAAVSMIASAPRGICMWAMGLTHHEHGVDNIHALANVALARGWLGQPGAGLLPIRGHSNVQGVGSMGVSPRVKEAFAAKLEALYGIHVPRTANGHTYASTQAAYEGRVRAAVMLGGNLWGSSPDSAWAACALRRIDTTVYVSTKLNPGHIHGRGNTTVILPCLARDEEHQATTQESMFNFVRRSDGGAPALSPEMRSEVEIIATLAEKILPPGRFGWSQFRSHAALRSAIAEVVPGYGQVSGLDETRQEFQLEGRTFHEPRFGTSDGRAHFVVTPLPDTEIGQGSFRGSFRLMTLRSEGQFNTVVYEAEDLYRGNAGRDAVLMAAADIAALGLVAGARVVVETVTGSMEATVAVAELPPGNIAMYYPEANVLVPRRIDEKSKTPAFKLVAASVRALDSALPVRKPSIAASA